MDQVDEDEAALEATTEIAVERALEDRMFGEVTLVTGQDRLQRLIADVDRVRRYAVAVIADARRAGVGVPIGVTARSRSGGPAPTAPGVGRGVTAGTTARAWRWSTSRPFRIRACGLRPGP